MRKVDEEIKALSTIGGWVASCNTKEQLDTVDKFLSDRIDNTEFNAEDIPKLNYKLGILKGAILTIREIKFNDGNNN